jgi:hypothetical protein
MVKTLLLIALKYLSLVASSHSIAGELGNFHLLSIISLMLTTIGFILQNLELPFALVIIIIIIYFDN